MGPAAATEAQLLQAQLSAAGMGWTYTLRPLAKEIILLPFLFLLFRASEYFHSCSGVSGTRSQALWTLKVRKAIKHMLTCGADDKSFSVLELRERLPDCLQENF